MHDNTMLLFEKHAKRFFQSGQRVLEIGPDSFPSAFRRALEDLPLEWHTLDCYDSPNLTYSNCGEYSFPIPDESYDVTLSGNVIEHVRKPWRWIPELARITRTNGLVITINPVSWPYHEHPVDCWRMFPEGMKALYEDASLSVVFSAWGSLELPHYRRYIPGISRTGPKHRLFYNFVAPLGFPVERAYDTITIGRKDAVTVLR